MRPTTCLVVVAALAGGCASSVRQDAHTSADGEPSGAQPLELVAGKARAHGIVTYPGGDRVDWKKLVLPVDARSSLAVSLQWRSPRPGLQLGFDVFDDWRAPVVASHRRGRASLEATIPDARGTYFIRVFAPGRGDAGAYQLTVDFTPVIVERGMPIELPDPPRLAELPPDDTDCSEASFDPRNPKCRGVCPGDPPQGWICGDQRCPSPPSVLVRACWAVMPCPAPPDERVADCKGRFPPCDLARVDPTNPSCRVARPPVLGRIVDADVSGGELRIEIAVGTAEGVEPKGWTAKVLRGDAGATPLTNGAVTIIRVGEHVTVGRVHLTADQLHDNHRVELDPPPPRAPGP